MIVPKKRTALLVNRLMVALKDAIEESEKQHIKNNFNKMPSRTIGDDFSPENVRHVSSSIFLLISSEGYKNKLQLSDDCFTANVWNI